MTLDFRIAGDRIVYDDGRSGHATVAERILWATLLDSVSTLANLACLLGDELAEAQAEIDRLKGAA